MQARIPRPTPESRRAFSLFEALAVIGIIGVLSWVVVASQSGTTQAVTAAKLDSDVATVNQAIKVYIASGGSLSGITDPQTVLDKMKTSLVAEDAQKNAGFSGAMIDRRLTVRTATTLQQQSTARRAVWTPSLMRFEIRDSGPGVAEFVLDEAAGRAEYGDETRSTSSLDYETENGWIWHYTDSAPQPRAVPAVVALSGASPSGNPVSPGAGSGHTQLAPPAFSYPPGSYPQSRFDLTVALTNPNSQPDTWIMYSLNGASYTRYGGPLTVAPDTEIAAFVTGDGARYYSSNRIEGLFCAKPPIILASPCITTSHSQFAWQKAETVEAALENSNDPAVSSLEYRIDCGPWVPYSGPFQLAINDHPNGAGITARALSRTVDYRMSAEASAAVQAPVAATALQAPGISTSEPNFKAGSVESITVTLSDPNPSGAGCVVEYCLDGASWQPYIAPFPVARKDYPAGLAVEARARSTSPNYTDSDAAASKVGLTPVALSAPVVSPSAPNFVSGSIETVSVTLTNPNLATAASVLEYRLNDGSWSSYSGPITIKLPANPASQLLEGRVKSTQVAYTDSAVTSRSIGFLRGTLQAPVIALSSTKFDASTRTIKVTLTDPNSSGTASLRYSVVATGQSHPVLTAYPIYSGPVTVSATDYPSGFTIQAYSKAIDPNRWSDSALASDAAGANFFGIPVTGKRILFVLDASSSMNAVMGNSKQTRFQLAVSELGKAITGLSSSLEFGVAFFNSGESWVYNNYQFQKATLSNKTAAISATNSVTTGRGTNYEVALAFPFRFSTMPDQVIFLTDGLPNHPNSWYDELAALVKAKVKVDCVGIACTAGAKVNLKLISSSTGGTVSYLDGTAVPGTTSSLIGSESLKTSSSLPDTGLDSATQSLIYTTALDD